MAIADSSRTTTRLLEFLCARRQRMRWSTLAGQLLRAVFWVALAAAAVALLRRSIAIPTGVLLVSAGMLALLVGAALTLARQVQIEQVIARLEIPPEARDL